MRSILTIGLIVVVAMATSSPKVHAMTGNQLLEMCIKGQGTSNEALLSKIGCSAYIAGVADLQAVFNPLLMRGSGMGFCIPQGATSEQLVNVVVRKLQTDPANTHLEGALIAYKALTEAFPCR